MEGEIPMKKSLSITFCLFLILNMSFPGKLSGQVSQWEEQLKTEPENTGLLMELGMYYHNLGGDKTDKDAVQKAEEYLSKLLGIDPGNGLAMVYLGSTITMKAQFTRLPWRQLNFMKKGFSRMDKAVYFEPDNPEVRLIRGINSASVPGMFARLSIALEDFQHIEKLHREKPLEMTSNFWLPFYYYYGIVLSKQKDVTGAKIKFEKTIGIDTESGYAQKAKKELKKIGESENAQ